VIIRAGTPKEVEAIAAAMQYVPSQKVNSVAILERDTLMAMGLYDHWTYSSVNVHIWSSSPRWLMHPLFIKEIFRYPFEVCNRKILLAVTPGDNEASLRFSKVLGFREIFRHKDGWKDGVDMVVKEMHRKECRWLQKKAA